MSASSNIIIINADYKTKLRLNLIKCYSEIINANCVLTKIKDCLKYWISESITNASDTAWTQILTNIPFDWETKV